jgi:hypothetical protein
MIKIGISIHVNMQQLLPHYFHQTDFIEKVSIHTVPPYRKKAVSLPGKQCRKRNALP